MLFPASFPVVPDKTQWNSPIFRMEMNRYPRYQNENSRHSWSTLNMVPSSILIAVTRRAPNLSCNWQSWKLKVMMHLLVVRTTWRTAVTYATDCAIVMLHFSMGVVENLKWVSEDCLLLPTLGSHSVKSPYLKWVLPRQTTENKVKFKVLWAGFAWLNSAYWKFAKSIFSFTNE